MKSTLNILYITFVTLVVAIALLFVGNRFGLFGYEIKIVQSGSMEPAIQTGGLVAIVPSAHYAVGDVITFGPDTATQVPTTHRIVATETSPLGRTLYTTKGDANEEADPKVVRENEIIGKVVASVPYVGYLLEFARTPWGYGLLVGVPALIIILDEIANITWEIHKYRHKRRRERTRAQRLSTIRLSPTSASIKAARRDFG